MNEEEGNAMKMDCYQRWSDARTTRACCDQKLSRMWEALRSLAKWGPESTSVGNEDGEFYYTGNKSNSISYPSASEIKRLLTSRAQAAMDIKQSRTRLTDMGMDLPADS